jgi:DNA-binding CsgD family transcriptional regulator
MYGEPLTGTGCDCRSGDWHLTTRECQVLPLIAAGMNNERIGQRLGISTRTVDQHVVTMRRRADAENRTELVARCYAAGILRSGVWPAAWTGRRCLAATRIWE